MKMHNGKTRPIHVTPVLATDLPDQGEVVITVPLPHLHATETLRALSEWSPRYSLSAWQLSWGPDGESCSLLLQMAVPYRSHSSPGMTAHAATVAVLKNLRQHWSRYGAKVNVDAYQLTLDHAHPTSVAVE